MMDARVQNDLHILATVLSPERLAYSLLVFKSLRTGFPDAQVHVYGNGLAPALQSALATATAQVDGMYHAIWERAHGDWISRLLQTATQPFWICDTDVIFYDKVEDWYSRDPHVLFAGAYEPEFLEPWSQSTHVARLHPSLMYFNSGMLRAAIRAFPGKPAFFRSVQHFLFPWTWVPYRDPVTGCTTTRFYDTCAGLHHTLGGTPFSNEQTTCFEHLFCGTYAHLNPHGKALLALHEAALQNPESARGFRRVYLQYLAKNLSAAPVVA